MSRVLQVARREYVATAMTKGFIIGAFIVPAIFVAAIPLIIVLTMNAKAPAVAGELAVIDRSGAVVDGLQDRLIETLAEERDQQREAALSVQQQLGPEGAQPGQEAMAGAVLDAMLPDVNVSVLGLGPDADADAAKELLGVEAERTDPTRRIGVAVIDADAVERADGAERFGGYQLFVRPKMDDRIIGGIRRTIRDAIRERRIETAGWDRAELNALTTVVNHGTREVTVGGDERESMEELTQMLPMIFMVLLVTSVMVGGGYLLTTTVEEKSSRVVELLLSATTPMQLMTGKIIGQMGVGFTLLFIYSGLGIGALGVFKLLYILNPITVLLMFVFFLASYFMIASLMAAVGSAVNDMREAQSMQTPVMMLIIVPYVLWLPISRDPNSVLAVVLSFVPPISPFIMMMRVVSTDPPPVWQTALSIAVMAVGAYACAWFAAKIFRIGLLMYGKPPNFKTLIRWARMA